MTLGPLAYPAVHLARNQRRWYMLVESKSIATKFQTSLQTGNNFVLQLGNYTKQIQKQYRIQAMSNLLSAVAITVELLLFRVDFAVLWEFLAFILGFIPNVGLIIACQRSSSPSFSMGGEQRWPSLLSASLSMQPWIMLSLHASWARG